MVWISDSIISIGYEILDLIPKSRDFLLYHEMQKKAYALGVGLEKALKYNMTIHDDAFKAGVSLDDVLKFSNHAQLHAFQRNIPLEIALKFSSHVQVHAFQRNISLDDALQFTNHCQLYCYEDGGFSLGKALNYTKILFDDTGYFFKGRYIIYEECRPGMIDGVCSIPTDFTSRVHFNAYELGASVGEALKFRYYFQADAFSTGISAEDALRFTELSQVFALEQGLSVEDSLKFTKLIQTYALKAGATMEHALKFTSDFQLKALQNGKVPAEDALQFTSNIQLDALFYYKLTAKDAVQFTSYDQLKAFREGASVSEALQIGKPTEEIVKSEEANDFCLVSDAYDNAPALIPDVIN